VGCASRTDSVTPPRGRGRRAARFAPHQLRHAHAVEMAREGMSLNVIQRQLEHTNLRVTSIYLQGDRQRRDHQRRPRPPSADDARQRRTPPVTDWAARTRLDQSSESASRCLAPEGVTRAFGGRVIALFLERQPARLPACRVAACDRRSGRLLVHHLLEAAPEHARAVEGHLHVRHLGVLAHLLLAASRVALSGYSI